MFQNHSWKNFFFLKKVGFLGHVFPPERVLPIAKPVKFLMNLKSTESKRDVMKVHRCLGFYICYIKNFHSNTLQLGQIFDSFSLDTCTRGTFSIKEDQNQRKYDSCWNHLSFSLSRALIQCENWLYSDSTVSWGRTKILLQLQSFLTKMNRDILHSIKTSVELFQDYRSIKTTSLGPHLY